MGELDEKKRQAIEFVVQTTKPVLEVETRAGLVRLAPYEDGDEHGILELFKTVFKVERSLEQWNWQYKDNPMGFTIWLGRLEDGTIVSQFTGLPAKAKVWDRTLKFSQIVDSMVHPHCRGGLKKRGLFARNLLAYAYNHGSVDDEVVQMGLPNPLAYRLGSQTCYYVPMSKCYAHTKAIKPEVDLPPPTMKVKGLGQSFDVSVPEQISADHDELWEKVKARHNIITYRNAAYMDWRYVRNPNWDYRLVEIRLPESNQLAGMAVTRSHWLDQPDLLICDWLVDREIIGAEQALIACCEELAKREGLTQVRCILNHNVAESRAFEDKGYDLVKTQFRLVSHTYAPDVVTEDDLMREWYYSAGDFDVS